MVYHEIGPHVRERVLHLLGNGWTEEEVRNAFGVSASSIRRWRAAFHAHGSIGSQKIERNGRRSKITPAVLDAVLGYLEEHPDAYLDEVQTWLLEHHDSYPSISALDRTIRASGFSYKLLRREAAERDQQLRDQWYDIQQNLFTAAQLLFVDESSKDDRTIYRRYGRSARGTRASIKAKFVRGERWSILPALTVDGYAALRIVPGSVDADEFYNFIVADVVRPN